MVICLHYYAVKNLIAYMSSNPKATFSTMCKDLKGKTTERMG